VSQVTLGELKQLCRKGARDPFWISNIFWRPFSIYVSWLAIRLGIRANAITLTSCLFALASSFVLLTPSDVSFVVSVVCMQVFFLLDHVDGEVARFDGRNRPPGTLNRAGSYFDRLVHYFQGPTFFACLGIGFAVAEQQLWWAVLGIIASIGSSGFPRFTASYELLDVVTRHPGEVTRRFATDAGAYYTIYWNPGDELRSGFFFPKTLQEIVFVAKQFIGFPGHLFAFAAAVMASVLLNDGSLVIKAFLAFYAAVLGVNTIYATKRYLDILSAVPVEESVSAAAAQTAVRPAFATRG
jgi:phosphatidylglycerophosphate synthase